jgi:hypothetical protein
MRRRSCGPRRSRSRPWRAACAAAPGPRGTTRCGSSRRRRGDPDLDPDALGAGLHRVLDRAAHRAAERHAAAQLLGDVERDDLGVELGVLDLDDVELDLLAGQLLEIGADRVGLGTTTADDDAGARAWTLTSTLSRVRVMSMRLTPA